MMKRTLINVLYISTKTVPRKPYINRESKSRRSQFSYVVIVVT